MSINIKCKHIYLLSDFIRKKANEKITPIFLQTYNKLRNTGIPLDEIKYFPIPTYNDCKPSSTKLEDIILSIICDRVHSEPHQAQREKFIVW